jgi:hypothetical protein
MAHVERSFERRLAHRNPGGRRLAVGVPQVAPACHTPEDRFAPPDEAGGAIGFVEVSQEIIERPVFQPEHDQVVDGTQTG